MRAPYEEGVAATTAGRQTPSRGGHRDVPADPPGREKFVGKHAYFFARGDAR